MSKLAKVGLLYLLAKLHRKMFELTTYFYLIDLTFLFLANYVTISRKILSLSIMNTPTLFQSPRFIVCYRTFLAFCIGYCCMQLLNMILIYLLNKIGIAQAESLFLSALCSIIFAIIFVFTCYIISSLRQLSLAISILLICLMLIRYKIIAI